MQAVETLRIAHNTTMDQDDRAGSVLMEAVESNKNINDSFLNLQATPPTHYHYKRRTDSPTPPNLYDGVFLAGTESQTKRQPTTTGRSRPLPIPMQQGNQSGVAVIVGLTEKASIQDSTKDSNGAAPTTEQVFASAGPKRPLPLPQPNGLQTNSRPAFPLFSHRRNNSSSSARSLASSQPSIVTQLSGSSGSSHASSSPSFTSLSFSASTTDVNSRTQKPSLIAAAVDASKAVRRAQAKGQGGSHELISLGDALLHPTANQNQYQNPTPLISSARSSAATSTVTLCQDDGLFFETVDPFKRIDVMNVAANMVGMEREKAKKAIKENEKEKEKIKDNGNYLLTKPAKAAMYGENQPAKENVETFGVRRPHPKSTPPPMIPTFSFQSIVDDSVSRGSGLFPGGITIGGEHMRFSKYPMPKLPPPPSTPPPERPLSSPPPPPMATSSLEGSLAGAGRYSPPNYPPPFSPDPFAAFNLNLAKSTNGDATNYLGVPIPVTQPLRLKQGATTKDPSNGNFKNDSSRLRPLIQSQAPEVSPIQIKPVPVPPVAFVPEGSTDVRPSASGKPRPVLTIRTWDLDVKKKRPPLPKPPQEVKSVQDIQKNWNEKLRAREAREQLAKQTQVNTIDSKPTLHVKGASSLDGSNKNNNGVKEPRHTHRVGPSIDSTNSSLRVAAHSNTSFELERSVVEPPKTLYGVSQPLQVEPNVEKPKPQEKTRGIKSISSKIGRKRPKSRSFTAGDVQFVMEHSGNFSDASINRPQSHRSNNSNVSLNSSLKSASKGLFRTGTSIFGFGRAARPQHPSSTTYSYQQPSAGGSLSSLRFPTRSNTSNTSSSSLPAQRNIQDKDISYPKEVFPPPNGLTNNFGKGTPSVPSTPAQPGVPGAVPTVQSWQVYQPYSYQTYQDSTIRSNGSGRSVQSERTNDWRGAPLRTNSFDDVPRDRTNSNASNSIRSGVGSNVGPITTGFVSGLGVGVGVGSEANRGGKGQSFLGKLTIGTMRKSKTGRRVDLFR